jgi:hypothetical protein
VSPSNGDWFTAQKPHLFLNSVIFAVDGGTVPHHNIPWLVVARIGFQLTAVTKLTTGALPTLRGRTLKSPATKSSRGAFLPRITLAWGVF